MKTRVIFLLDRSGSMQTILEDTIGGFNSYISTLRESDEADNLTMTLVQFDSRSIDTVYKDMPIGDVPELTKKTFVPGDMTPLVEAGIRTIKSADKKWDGRTIMVILTDGLENASGPGYTSQRLAKLVAKRSKKGWQFLFLGASIDAYKQAQAMGIGRGQTVSYDSSRPVASAALYGAVAGQTLRGAGGQSMGFSVKVKEAVGDKFVPDSDEEE